MVLVILDRQVLIMLWYAQVLFPDNFRFAVMLLPDSTVLALPPNDLKQTR